MAQRTKTIHDKLLPCVPSKPLKKLGHEECSWRVEDNVGHHPRCLALSLHVDRHPSTPYPRWGLDDGAEGCVGKPPPTCDNISNLLSNLASPLQFPIAVPHRAPAQPAHSRHLVHKIRLEPCNAVLLPPQERHRAHNCILTRLSRSTVSVVWAWHLCWITFWPPTTFWKPENL